MAPWEDVPMGGDRWPDNTSLRHYSVLQRPPTTPHTNNQRHNADVSVASLLVLGHQLLLDPQPHPGARAGLVGQVSFSGSGSLDDVFFDRDASLHCDFDTQGEELYSVKWYKVSLLVYFGS